jgi:carboxypeptidase C (cathepsin A)
MLGPKRVPMLADGGMPAPPYRLVDNEYSWLDLTDIVFIDPVGTGFSRPATAEQGKEFWGLEQDIRSVGEFIRLYLTRSGRWSSPLYLIGESYGTTRAAGLSGYLVDRSGVAFNGVILVSSVLNFQTLRFAEGNDLPYLTYLPTYTATAWYHRKLEPELQADLEKTLEEVRTWATERYWVALAKGSQLTPAERQETAAALSRYTGLSKEFIEQCDLRVDDGRFRKELLRDRGLTVGRLDSRFVGMDRDAAGEEFEFDPSMAAIRPPYTAAFNDYVRSELGYESDLHYWILGGGIGKWDFGDEGRFPDTSKALRDAMLRNSYMKVFIASGYYDMATPFFGTEYTVSHLGIPESLRKNLRIEEYEAGHMMYIHEGSLARMKSDIATFYQETKSMTGRGAGNVPGQK